MYITRHPLAFSLSGHRFDDRRCVPLRATRSVLAIRCRGTSSSSRCLTIFYVFGFVGLNMTLACRCVRTAGSGGCWASGSRSGRPSLTPRFLVRGVRTSPDASVCAGSPACCCPSCPGGCRALWATRCPAALGAPSLQVWIALYYASVFHVVYCSIWTLAMNPAKY